MFVGCPIVWKSSMQTLTALSTTEAKYIALSTQLREVIHIINLLNKLWERKFYMCASTPKIKCKVFEDNLSCNEMAIHHKTRPRTKHLPVKLHHFRSFVVNNIITIKHVRSCERIADMFTKPLAEKKFAKLRDKMMNGNINSNGHYGVLNCDLVKITICDCTT